MFVGVRHGARYSRWIPEPREEHKEALQELIKFFVTKYIALLTLTKLRYLFKRIQEEHLLVPRFKEADGSWWMLEHGISTGAGTLDQSIRGTNMHGMDLVVAISQSSINNQFRSRFLGARDVLHRWSPLEGAVVGIKGVSAVILSNSRAIFTVHITDATLQSKILNDKIQLVDE